MDTAPVSKFDTQTEARTDISTGGESLYAQERRAASTAHSSAWRPLSGTPGLVKALESIARKLTADKRQDNAQIGLQ